jgi:Lon protease-like protein
MSTRLAMFPLRSVLVPHAFVSLHVFEPRYRVLMFDCLRGDREFGVVLIERGSEVGGRDQRFGVATVAHIDHAAEFPDGRWVMLAVGTRRVDVVEWLADDPYPVALVDERSDPPWPETEAGAATEEVLAQAEQSVRRILALAAEAGEKVPSAEFELSPEPVVAGWQLLALAPIASLDKQALLAVDDHETRVRMLLALAEDQSLLLAYRLNRE